YIEGKCRLPVRLIIFDTLARCYGNLDENNSQDMGRLIVGCDAIKNGTSASVLLVHHSGKDETKGARGSSSLKAALDVEFNVKKDKENQSLI
ncbi:helicase RepA family protein, partial [Klebsiella pneumoniae]|nr:helicase RepA family protein [Klebsiella pneumoniae]